MKIISINGLPFYLKIWWIITILLLIAVLTELILTGSYGILLFIFIISSCSWGLVVNRFYKIQ